MTVRAVLNILDTTFEGSPAMRRTLYVAAFLLLPTVLLAALSPLGRSGTADAGFIAARQAARQAAQQAPVYDEQADAVVQIEAALAIARRENTRVLVQWGGNWCGWCHRLEIWLARPRVAMIWSQAFVDLKIDQDRDVDGMTLEQQYTGGKPSGIPFFVIVEPDGRVVADSFIMPDGGNVGCPWSEEELTLFGQFLEKNVPAIGEAERASLIGEMVKLRQEEEAAAAGQG
jgi:thiol:disulfide interchange protein